MTELTLSFPKINLNRKSLFLRIVIFLLILFWCAGFTFPVIFNNSEYAIIFHPLLEKIYSSFCHQSNEKTFVIFGSSMLVCARCAGIYFGAFISAFLIIFIQIKFINNIKFLYAACIPMIFDIIFYSIGIYNYSKTFAFITGLIFGSIIIIFIYDALNKILLKKYFNQ